MASPLPARKPRAYYVIICLMAALVGVATLSIFLRDERVFEPVRFQVDSSKRLYENKRAKFRDGRNIEGENTTERVGMSAPVYDILPWPIKRHRFLPNFFTRRTAEPADYRSSHVAFLHHNKAGGSSLKNIIKSYAKKTEDANSMLVSWRGFCIVQSRVERSRLQWDNKRFLMVGGYAFGVCDLVPASRPCSYFTLFRNPYTRIVSSYFHCQNHDDQLCGGVDSQNVSIEAWAKHQGSYFFQQLLLHPDMCSQDLDKYAVSYKELTAQDMAYGNAIKDPYWFIEKSYLHFEVSKEQRRHLLNYCLNNMEKWFAVVGIIEEYELSLAMFEEVFGIPFFEKKDLKVNTMKSSNSKNTTLIESMITRLKDDEEVREAISADLALYEKMYDIFNRQRTVLESRAMSS